jgi:hypothetical protein
MRRAICAVLGLLGLALVTNSQTLSSIRLRQRETLDRFFVDAEGRERHFHGVNAIVKGFARFEINFHHDRPILIEF